MSMSCHQVFELGQALGGRLGKYVITKEIQSGVWLVKNWTDKKVIIKSVADHPRVENERDVLKRFQHRTPYLRPLVDEIVEPATPTAIVLRHLNDQLLNASIKQTLNRKELKYVSKCVLEALKVLHEDDYVHTDVKPDNVFVNYMEGEVRYSTVQLGDLGGTYPADSKVAKAGTPVGAPMWSSPEVLFEISWKPATEIWSFGTLLISLIYGGNFNIFRPRTVSYDHEEYGLEILKNQFRYFGPFPSKYEQIASQETVAGILWLMQEIPQAETIPFHRVTEREVSKGDKEFIGKIMMLGWRDRPTAKELLEDKWFKEEAG